MMFQSNRETKPKTAPANSTAHLSKGKVQHSIIGSNVTITGDLHSAGDIMVHGTVEGSITCRSLTLGDAPTVSKVKAETVRISGQFSGEIKAKEVILSRAARVTGDIWHDSLTVESGASIEGRLARLSEKKAKAKDKAKAEVEVKRDDKVTDLKAASATA